MSDLLRAARAARSLGFVVGLGRVARFRSFSVALTCVGIGFALYGTHLFALVVAGTLFLAVRPLRALVARRAGRNRDGHGRRRAHSRTARRPRSWRLGW